MMVGWYSIGKEQCPQEDYRGRRCVLGAGHEATCRFGAARLTERQERQLRLLLCAVPNGVLPNDWRTASSLVKLALIYITLDDWGKPYVKLTLHGERLTRELSE